MNAVEDIGGLCVFSGTRARVTKRGLRGHGNNPSYSDRLDGLRDVSSTWSRCRGSCFIGWEGEAGGATAPRLQQAQSRPAVWGHASQVPLRWQTSSLNQTALSLECLSPHSSLEATGDPLRVAIPGVVGGGQAPDQRGSGQFLSVLLSEKQGDGRVLL